MNINFEKFKKFLKIKKNQYILGISAIVLIIGISSGVVIANNNRKIALTKQVEKQKKDQEEKKAAEEKKKAEEEKAKAEKEKKEKEEKQVSNDNYNNSNRNQNANSNNDSNNNYQESKPEEKPKEQPKPQPPKVEHHYNTQLGNSGMFFNSFDEAEAYVDSVMAEWLNRGYNRYKVMKVFYNGVHGYTVDFRK